MLYTPAFESFVAPARRYPQIWRMILGIISGGIVYMFGAAAVVLLGHSILFPDASGMDVTDIMNGNASTPEHMILVLGTFAAMGLGTFVMAAWHWRGPASLFGARDKFGVLFLLGLLIVIAANALVFLVLYVLVGPAQYIQNMSYGLWASYLPVAFAVLFVQITSEELLFRGYLQQQMAARFKNPFWWMVLPSVLFGLGHYDAGVDPSLRWLILLATTLFGLIAADLTRLTGSLAMAMGLHMANNFIALCVVGTPGHLSGLALFHAPFSMEDVAVVKNYIMIDLVIMGIIWVAARKTLR